MAHRYENVQDYYGRVLQNSKDLKTSACTAAGRPPQGIIDAIGMVPEEVTSKYVAVWRPWSGSIVCATLLNLALLHRLDVG